MTDVFGDNIRALDASAGLITEVAFPEPQNDVFATKLLAPTGPDVSDRAFETTSPTLVTSRVPRLQNRLGGALSYDDDLVGSWSVDDDRVTITTMPALQEHTHGRRALEFDVDIVGCDASVINDGRDIMVGVVTSDGFVHTVIIPLETENSQSMRGPPPGDDFSQVSSVGLGAGFSEVAVKGVALVGTTVCVGKEHGGVVCFPRTEVGSIGEGFVLGGQSGILGNVASYLGSYLSGSLPASLSSVSSASISPLACVSSVTVDGARNLLFALHEDSTLNVWEVSSRSLIYSAALLPNAQREAFVPSCLNWNRDLLSPGGVFLIASFEEQDDMEVPTSIAALFEVTVGDRGTQSLNVHVENGPQLPDIRGRVTSSSLEFVAANGYRLWLVMDGGDIECISFKGDTRGRHSSASYKVETLEMRLGGLVPGSDVELEILKMFFVELQRSLENIGDGRIAKTMRSYVLDTIRLPWNTSKQAVVEAARQVGVSDRASNINSDASSLMNMVQSIQGWIDASVSVVDAFERSMAFFKAYVQAVGQISPPRSIHVIQRHPSSSERVIALIRGDSKVSAMVDASGEEFLRYGDASYASLASVAGPCMGTPAMAMVRYAMCQGLSLKHTLLPVVSNIVAGRCHLNSVEFGRHHVDVRQAFRSFSVAIASLNEATVQLFDSLVKLSTAREGSMPSSMPLWTVRSFGTTRKFELDDVRVSMAKAALDGCARARIDLSLQLLVVANVGNGVVNDAVDRILASIESYLQPAILSQWACTMAIAEEPSEKADAMILDGTTSSKRMKRQSGGRLYHAFELAVVCCNELSTMIFEQNVPMLGMDALRLGVLQQFLSIQNTMRPLMHALMRNRHASNKMELLDSLLRVIEAGDDVSFKFFKAYNLLRKTRCMATKGLMEQSRLEQEGLGLLFSLCDRVENEELAECISSVTGRDALPRLTVEAYVDAVSEIVDHLGCSFSAVRAGLFSARIHGAPNMRKIGDKRDSEASARALARVCKVLEEGRHMQEAYSVALSVPDPQRQLDCLKSLVASICTHNMLGDLCALPLVELMDGSGVHVLDQVTHALWDRAMKEPIDGSTTYLILYDFFVSRGNFQSAASALLSYARRITSESERGELEKLLVLQKTLTMTVGCLRLLRESDAWLEDGASDRIMKVRKTEEFEMEYLIPTVITVKDIEKELISVKSLLKVVSLNPEFDVQSASHHDVLVELLERGMYGDAWLLASTLPSNDIRSSKELIVFKMSKDAFTMGRSTEVTSESSTSASQMLWTEIQSLVAREPLAMADRLRLAAAEGILETDAATSLPYWLIEPYLSKYEPLSSQSMPQTQRADISGMIRLLLHYGRVQDAANLALEMLDPLITSLPSVAFPKMGAVHIPHDLIDMVVASLRKSTTDAEKLLLSRLESAICRCNASSSRQSAVLSG